MSAIAGRTCETRKEQWTDRRNISQLPSICAYGARHDMRLLACHMAHLCAQLHVAFMLAYVPTLASHGCLAHVHCHIAGACLPNDLRMLTSTKLHHMANRWLRFFSEHTVGWLKYGCNIYVCCNQLAPAPVPRLDANWSGRAGSHWLGSHPLATANGVNHAEGSITIL